MKQIFALAEQALEEGYDFKLQRDSWKIFEGGEHIGWGYTDTYFLDITGRTIKLTNKNQ